MEADLTIIGKATCKECGKEINIYKSYPDWGPDYETGDPCPGCKDGKVTVTPVEPSGIKR